jgi:hypothetical protein
MHRLWRPPLAGGIHVCGCGHSGTSILTRLIGAHSAVHPIAGESGVAKKESYGRYRLALERFRRESAAAGCSHWVEKTPKHVRHLRFILDAAPDSRIVLICREPRDCVASLHRRYGRFGKALRRWLHDNGRVKRWRHHPQTFLLRYEDLVRDPQDSLERLMPFLGLAFEPGQLHYHEEQVRWYGEGDGGGEQGNALAPVAAVDAAAGPGELEHVELRNHQINQPLFNRTGTYAQILSPAEVERVRRRCGRLARTLGYRL